MISIGAGSVLLGLAMEISGITRHQCDVHYSNHLWWVLLDLTEV